MIRNLLRRLARNPALADALAAQAATPATTIRMDLDAALATLPAEPRLCVVLAYGEGMSHAEISAATSTRLRTRYRIAAIAVAIAVAIAIAIAATPWLVDFSVVLFGGFAASPWAWLAPMPIGLLLAYRSSGLRWPR
jgi:hypothetical protein